MFSNTAFDATGNPMFSVLAFDVFGTVFDLSKVDHEEVRAYAHHIRQSEWSPLHLPAHWATLPAHADSAEGIRRLREKFMVVTCSNGPLGLLTKLSKHNGISWDAIIPLELNKVFKPNHAAYMTVCEVLDVETYDVMMVTANATFGDLEAAAELGMEPMLIHRFFEGEGPKTIPELAERLGC